MDTITSIGAAKQSESIRLQAESLRNQHGDAISSVGHLTVDTPPREPVEVSASISPTTQHSNGFYTVPWPASPEFVMPNVLVQAMGCDALPESDASVLIQKASAKNKLDPGLLRAVMDQESAMHPCAISTAGAMGLMQIMPGTADELGLDDPFDPAANVDAGARYLRQMLDRYHGNASLALAAYNAGPGRTDKANGNVPQISETIGYVSRILANIPLF